MITLYTGIAAQAATPGFELDPVSEYWQCVTKKHIHFYTAAVLIQRLFGSWEEISCWESLEMVDFIMGAHISSLAANFFFFTQMSSLRS